MGTVGEFRVAVEEFALEETLARVPEAEFDVERAIPCDPGRLQVILWTHGPDHEELRAAIADDPAVTDVQGLVDLDVEWLYQMHWIDGLHALAPALAEYDATLMRAYGSREGWHLRLLAPDRRVFGALAEWCEARGLRFEAKRVYDLNGRVDGRFGLSENQYEALSLAYDRGYFESPRATDASELAAALGISQQAFSERLQRGWRNLLERTIATDDPPAAFSYPDRWRASTS